MIDKVQIKAIIKQYSDKSMNNFNKALKDDGKEAVTTKYWDGFSDCANLLLLEIDSLQEEPIREEFEKALTEEWQGYVNRGAATVDALEDNTQELAFAKGFYRGANWQKEQLLAKAIDGEVTYGKSLAIPSLGYRLDKERLDFGDKVKVIVIKED